MCPQQRNTTGCGGVQAANLRALFQDDPGAQKADARDNVGDDPGCSVCAKEPGPEVREGGGANGDQDVGPQSRRALPPLPLRSDQGAQDERNRHAREGTEELRIEKP
jgi:hypothetical protein